MDVIRIEGAKTRTSFIVGNLANHLILWIMREGKSFFLFVLFFVFYNSQTPVWSQSSVLNVDFYTDYQRAVERYQNDQFLAVQQILEKLKSDDLSEGLKQDVDFYWVLSSIKLENKDAFYQAEAFKKEHPVYSQMTKLDLLITDYRFEHNQFKEAIPIYESIKAVGLTQEEKDKYNFRLGYSYYIENAFDKANTCLYKVKDRNSIYAAPANYYYGHIAYQNKKYTTALKAFRQIENSPQFKEIVPYYFIHIAFEQSDYSQVIQDAPEFFKTVSEKRKPEIAQVLGISYFKMEKYAQAIPYLEFYRVAVGSAFTRESYYQLAFAYLKNRAYEQALQTFEKIELKEDELSQNTLYNSAACYLELGQKQFAGEAFYQAYQLNLNRQLGEDAMFNFAKISYELANDPYNKAIKALLDFMTNYPNSERIVEANEYLVNLFLSAKNYKGALEEIERIPQKNHQLLAAYQRITYNRAIELYREQTYEQAQVLFAKSAQYNYDSNTRIKAKFWLAECHYQLKNYQSAAQLFEELHRLNSSNPFIARQALTYNLAYAFYQQDNYEQAKTYFKQSVQNSQVGNPRYLDAYLRLADIYFISKDFNQAIAYYEQAEKISSSYLAYAVYQKAEAYGGNGDLESKISVLQSLTRQRTDYDLSDDAFYELGNTYVLLGKDREAIHEFQALNIRFPNSPFVRIALLKMGLANYNLDNRSEALQNLKRVVAQFPGTQESKEALVSIRNIYVESNTTEEFFAYVNSLPNARIRSSEQDTITYRAAENVYMKGDCESAMAGFSKYILSFPQGTFSINAHYYRGECYLKSNSIDQAAEDFQFVSRHKHSLFYEIALLKLASIYSAQERFREALERYTDLYTSATSDKNKMIALLGQLDSYHQLNNYDSTMWVAQQILRSPNADDQSYKRAHMFFADAAFKTNQMALAKREFQIVEKLLGGEISAEAKYHLALIQYQLGDYKNSEKMIFELINDYASYDFWIAKGFILLADIYVKYGNTFQAKHTLQSIIDNQSDTTLIEIAKQKKKVIIELEFLDSLENNKQQINGDTIRLENNLIQ
ncbi:MAG: tetratricopeptide repeat protein [Bacteroidales bacterium]|nr:tetratricopeptide repeat protein [Bacteroidales bacterium]